VNTQSARRIFGIVSLKEGIFVDKFGMDPLQKFIGYKTRKNVSCGE
jgi:hypothetical protein